jgi:hypothetical protein
MKNLSIEAKEIINDLLGKGHSPFDIKLAMEDGAYLKQAGISQEISEEIHFFLSVKRTYKINL